MRRLARAFSLLELLVVVAIMAILAAVAVPAIKALTQNNNQKQARNMVSAYIASARATALQQRRFAGVIFFEDPSNKNQVAVRLVRETSTSGNLIYFDAVVGSNPEFLPRGIRIGVLDDSVKFIRTEQHTVEQRSRVILFDSNGQLVLRNLLGVREWNGATAYEMGNAVFTYTDIANKTTWKTFVCTREHTGQTPGTVASATYWREEQWYLYARDIGPPNSERGDGNSTPGIVIWDDNELNSSGATTDAARGTWILKNADVVIVNAYTGNLIDGLK